jgi:DNA-binding MarR family transcriptional regulator
MISLEDQVIIALRQIAQAIELYSRRLLVECGLTAPQIGTLQELQRRGSCTPGALAEALHLSPQTMAGILQRLQQRDFITRTPAATDGRSVMIGLTAAGQQALAAAPPLLREQFRREMARLPVWEQTQMLATLQRIAWMMHAKQAEPIPFLFTDGENPDAPRAVRGEPEQPG